MAKSQLAITDDDFVDLGLSVMWAKCNLGAKAPEEYGNYYAWGEIEPKPEYTKDNSMTYRKVCRVCQIIHNAMPRQQFWGKGYVCLFWKK